MCRVAHQKGLSQYTSTTWTGNLRLKNYAHEKGHKFVSTISLILVLHTFSVRSCFFVLNSSIFLFELVCMFCNSLFSHNLLLIYLNVCIMKQEGESKTHCWLLSLEQINLLTKHSIPCSLRNLSRLETVFPVSIAEQLQYIWFIWTVKTSKPVRRYLLCVFKYILLMAFTPLYNCSNHQAWCQHTEMTIKPHAHFGLQVSWQTFQLTDN